ncbi:MAG: hypothetical protein ACK4UN_02290 [Limisphaerales bacterium]
MSDENQQKEQQPKAVPETPVAPKSPEPPPQRKPNPNIKPPAYRSLTEGYDPDQTKKD